MYDPEQITFFAKTDARGNEVPFGIKANDRTRHVYVIGKTGMGKSTLLENMAVQDIKNGNGLAFIDPHGQTAETLLDYIPEERKDDVVYFAPFDTDNPISFNVMEDVGEDQRHLVVSGLMSVFKKIWVDAWSARMEYILSNTLLALLEYPDSTLLGVNRMLSDKDYRMRVIENITDPSVKSFWVDEFLKYNERYMQEAGDAIKNKIGQFTSNPLIRNIIGQPHSSFDIRKIMDDKKILIMNLSKGLVGDQNANLLGSMLTTRIYLAAMSRANLTAEEMRAAPNFYFYVDEFQSFANATFADILSEARKYKLNLTIAHQYIEQMEEEVRNAVFGNVGTIISFRVGPFDAEVLETVYTPTFLAPDIVNLGFAQIYLTLMIDGIGSAPFSATTLPPIEITGSSYKEVVVVRSRELYTKKREPVEEKINEWHAKSFNNKPPYVPKHLREIADGGTLPNTGENLKKHGQKGAPEKKTNVATSSTSDTPKKESTYSKNDTRNSKEPYQRKEYKDKKTYPERTNTAGVENKRRDIPAEKTDERTQNDAEKKTWSKGDTKASSATDRSSARTQERKSVKSDKNLNELRSVLKGISGDSDDSDKKEDSQKKEEVRKESGKNIKEKDESPLKDALAVALAGAVTQESSVESDKEKVSEVRRPQVTQKREEKVLENVHSGRKEKEQREQKPRERKEKTNPSESNTFVQKKEIPSQGTKNEVREKRPHVEESNVSKQQRNDSDSRKQIPVALDAPQSHNEYAQMKNIDDPLSVKKLERMMRTNTGDKTPIK